jgi:hypothetical protein
MSDSRRKDDRFELSEFVLGYLHEQGSLVNPPAYGLHEVLMPDDLAAGLRLDAYQRLAFASTSVAATLQVGYSHPLVDEIARRLILEPGHGLGYVNNVRPEKRGLAELAAKTLSFPNARLSPKQDASEQRALHHYLRFNFKVMFVSDEKQEQLVSVVMDVQAGHAVWDAGILGALESFEATPAFGDLPVAAPRWIGADTALSVETYRALLTRATAAMRVGISDHVQSLQVRTRRHLELDRARIENYYGDLERDLERRLERLTADENERRTGLEDKLAALHAERVNKLADATARYQLRLELELINLLLLTQPKVLVPVEVANRTTTLTRMVVWDPLLHRLEPLVCDACGQPGEGLYLCTGGHLAHRNCLAPQCIDCTRVYCRLCQAEVGQCVVCSRPVCRHSLITCVTCGRATCQNHRGLCHAAAGEPARLAETSSAPAGTALAGTALAAKAPAVPVPALEAPASRTLPKPAPKTAKQPTPAAARSAAAKAKASPKPALGPGPITKGVKINVEVYEDRPEIIAFVMRSANRELATRSFRLTPEGIAFTCTCEKAFCPVNGIVYRPASGQAITAQIKSFLADLHREYLVPAKKTEFFFILGQRVREAEQLILPPIWRDETRLSQAQDGFDALSRRQKGKH